MAYEPGQAPEEKWWRKGRPGRMKNGVVGLSAAAIVSVYAAGYIASAGAESSTSVADVDPAAGIQVAASMDSDEDSDAPALVPTATATTGIARTVQGTVATPAPATSGSAAGATAATTYKDGVYAGTGAGPHGDLDVQVTVQGGKVVSVTITRCGTRYPCSRISELPARVIAAQSATISYVSRATDSSVAFARAVAVALAQAKA